MEKIGYRERRDIKERGNMREDKEGKEKIG